MHGVTRRITKYFQCSYECFVCSLSYIDMLLADHFVLNAFSVHRTILVSWAFLKWVRSSVMEAAKFYDDCFFNNEFYARVGGVPVEELNALEMDFLFAIHFSLIVPLDAYQELHNELFLHWRELPLSLRVVVTRRWAPHSASGYRAEDADLLVSLLLLHDVFGQSVITSRPCPTVHLASRLLQQTTIRLGASRTSCRRSRGCGGASPSALSRKRMGSTIRASGPSLITMRYPASRPSCLATMVATLIRWPTSCS